MEALRDHTHPRPGFPVAWHSAHASSSALELRSGEVITALRLRPEAGANERPYWTVEQAGVGAMKLAVLADDGVRLRFICDGRQRQAHYAWTPSHTLTLELDSHTHEFVEHRPHESSLADANSDGNDGRVRAPTMGRVLALWAELGQRVEPGARLLTLEAMKIESTITSPIAGTIEALRVAVGDQVDKAQVLVTITPDATPTDIDP
jgi:biotin carboxyl carrier protein